MRTQLGVVAVLEVGALGQLDVFVGDTLVGTPGRLERTFGSMDELVLAVGERLKAAKPPA